jgi:hypothetical protein
MQYYVIGPDGNKYGPADVPTLKQWVAENRLSPDSMLEDFGTGQRVTAGSVPDLFGDPQIAAAPTAQAGPTMSAPVTGTVYQQAPSGARPQGAADDGKIFVILGWVAAGCGLALFCCPYVSQLLAVTGVIFAFVAASKGHPGAKALKIFSIVALVITIGVLIALFAFNDALQQWAEEMRQQQGRR